MGYCERFQIFNKNLKANKTLPADCIDRIQSRSLLGRNARREQKMLTERPSDFKLACETQVTHAQRATM